MLKKKVSLLRRNAMQAKSKAGFTYLAEIFLCVNDLGLCQEIDLKECVTVTLVNVLCTAGEHYHLAYGFNSYFLVSG